MPSKSPVRKPTPRKPAAKRPSGAHHAKRATHPTAPAKPATAKRSQAPATAKRGTPVEPPASASKQSQLIALLRSPAGGTIASMTALTGWQPHTVRGTISGVLRKKLKLNVACIAEEGGRVYRIIEGTA